MSFGALTADGPPYTRLVKSLALCILITGCIPMQTVPDHYYNARLVPGGTRVTLEGQGISVLLPDDGSPRGAQPWRENTWIAGIINDPNVTKTEVEIDFAPPATTLAEEQAVLHMACLKLEVLDRKETADGFDILYGCTDTNLQSTFRAVRVADIGGRKVQCGFAGSLPDAKSARRYCTTMEAAR
jgi:hypothetical protein